MLALLSENGPYIVQDDLSLRLNPNSWNENASVMWVDQPVGTGFSYSSDDSLITSEKQMADDMLGLLQTFFTDFSNYTKLPFHAFGESYAGQRALSKLLRGVDLREPQTRVLV